MVVGNGLGPELLKPVPFVMARRRGHETQFAALLEPYGETPRITGHRGPIGGWFQVTATDFEDRTSFQAGSLRFIRRAGAAVQRLGLAGEFVLEESGQVLLELETPFPVQVDFSADQSTLAVSASEGWTGELRVLAPQAQEVMLNGIRVNFRREGNYCIIPWAGSPVND